MSRKATPQEIAERRTAVLSAAKWCFLNFGFGKTSLDDIAKRADLSRTLLYHLFKDKEDIFTAVFADWLVSRHPAAREAAAARTSKHERLIRVCRLMLVEPWSDMHGAPMADQFFDVCERLDPAIAQQHRQHVLQCVTTILKDAVEAEVFVLALDGLLTDDPATEVLEHRVGVLARRFVWQPKS